MSTLLSQTLVPEACVHVMMNLIFGQVVTQDIYEMWKIIIRGGCMEGFLSIFVEFRICDLYF